MRIDIKKLLDNYQDKSMRGLMRDDDGRPMTDKEVRAELQRHLSLGHTTLTIYDQDEDTIFYIGGCPAHDIKIYDYYGNEITKRLI